MLGAQAAAALSPFSYTGAARYDRSGSLQLLIRPARRTGLAFFLARRRGSAFLPPGPQDFAAFGLLEEADAVSTV
ncbi:MAG: hypothetical protein RL339_2235 [Pseudomonadota bacterium]|jgi:hypothetical protein